ncbi:MAG: SpoIIE family protein phosphatase [Actinomycetota bacterium]|nr:SpoIIE family protein phosphatase [Actinomycetota bacterium]
MGTGHPASREQLEEMLASARAEASAASALLTLASRLSEMGGFEDTIRRAVETCRDMFGAERTYVVSRRESGGALEVVTSVGFDPDLLAQLEESAGVGGGLPLMTHVLENQSVMVLPDVATSSLLDADEAQRRALGAYVGIPLLRGKETIGGMGLEFSRAQDFGRAQERMAEGIARLLGMALVNARRFTMLTKIRAFGLRISTRQRLGDLTDEISKAARELVDADHAEVVLAGSPAALLEESDDGLPWARLQQREVLSLQGPALPEPGAALAVGLLASDGSILGALVLSFSRPLRLGPLRTEALRVAAAQAGIAIENSQRFERQRAMAKTLQRALVTQDVPCIEGYELAWIYEASEADAEVGGDFYDVFELGDSVAVVVGDISGKGLEAAAQTAMAKYMLRAYALRNHRPDSVLYHLNNALVGRIGTDRFATAFYGVLDTGDNVLEFALGGHPPPFVFRAASAAVESMTAPGHLLGAFEEQTYATEKTTLEEGDGLVVFTDGLIEARRDDELFGAQRVAASIGRHAAGASSEELVQRVYEDARSFGEVTDDTVVLALKRVPAPMR